MVRKTFYITQDEDLILDVWNTPPDIEGIDFKRLINSNINMGGKATIVLFLYKTNNRESFSKLADDYFSK